MLGPELLVRRPWWLADGQRGWGVPEHMHWRPLVTFIQTAMDAANAMVSVPGEFGSFGHDYRADMVRFVRDALPCPPPATPRWPPAHRAGGGEVQAGVPLRQRRTSGARRLRGRPPPPRRDGWQTVLG